MGFDVLVTDVTGSLKERNKHVYDKKRIVAFRIRGRQKEVEEDSPG